MTTRTTRATWNQTISDIGDLQAIEGTKVTIKARGNEAIKEAYVDFESDGRRDLTMQSEGDLAEVTFPLALRPDRRTPQYTNYILRMVTQDDRRNETTGTAQDSGLSRLCSRSAKSYRQKSGPAT